MFVIDGQAMPLTIDADHIDAATYGYDLMNSRLSVGLRKLPSQIDSLILTMAWNSQSLQRGDPGIPAPLVSDAADDSETPSLFNSATSPVMTINGEPIVNGHFEQVDSGASDFGWVTRGMVDVSGQHAILGESPTQFASLKQSFVVPAGATSLTFLLESVSLFATAAEPVDTFEVALVDSATGLPLAGTAENLSQSDALLNLQPDGSVYFGRRVSIPGASVSGGIATLSSPTLVTIDLRGIRAGTMATLYFDLLGFGDSNSTVTIDDVAIIVDQSADLTPPQLTLPQDFTVEATGSNGAIANYLASAVDDMDGTVPVDCSSASGSLFALGQTSVACNAVDLSGNRASGSFVITVADRTAPALNLPQDRRLEATGPAGAVVAFQTSAVDQVSGSVVVSCSTTSGSTLPIGSTVVSCSAVDAVGNRRNGSFTVTVTDSTAPQIVGPANGLIAEATGPSGAVVKFTVSSQDAVDGNLSVSCAPGSGASFPIGSTTVQCQSTDTRGNSASTQFVVTVADTTAPTLTLPASLTAEATGPNGAAIVYSASPNDLGDGPTVLQCSVATGSQLPIGVTIIDCTSTDSRGNRAVGSFAASVVDTTAPAVSVPSSLVIEATGPHGAAVTYTATASDVVDGAAAVNCSVASGTVLPLGATTIDCTSTDNRGNRGTGQFIATVRDTTPPIISVPAEQIVEATGPLGAIVNLSVLARDLVDGELTSNRSPSPTSIFPMGTTLVSCTATDATGNHAQASFSITVRASGAISGYVYVDTNNNGLKDPAEVGLPNVPVSLSAATRITVLTGPNGDYHFENIPPGSYQIDAFQASAFMDSKESLGTPGIGRIVNDQFLVDLTPGTKLNNYNFGERGLRAQFISKQLLLASTQSVIEMMVDLIAEDSTAVFTFSASSSGTLIVTDRSVGPGEAEAERATFEVYTSGFVPVALGGQGSMMAPLTAGEQYVLVVTGATGRIPVDLEVRPESSSALGTRYHNTNDPVDVDANGVIGPLDAILIINELNAHGSHALPNSQTQAVGPPYIDVNGFVAPLDAILVINWLNSQSASLRSSTGAEGEGESSLGEGTVSRDTVFARQSASDKGRLDEARPRSVDQVMQSIGSSSKPPKTRDANLVDGEETIADWLESVGTVSDELGADLIEDLTAVFQQHRAHR